MTEERLVLADLLEKAYLAPKCHFFRNLLILLSHENPT